MQLNSADAIFLLIFLQNFRSSFEFLEEVNKECTHDMKEKKAYLYEGKSNRNSNISIDFYVPFDWLSGDERLLISCPNVDIVLVKPSTNCPKGHIHNLEGQNRTEFLNISYFNYGWNKIYLKSYNRSIYTVVNDEGEIVLEKAKQINISSWDELKFFVSGMNSLVNCFSEWKYFQIDKSLVKIPLVFKDDVAAISLDWNSFYIKAFFIIGGTSKFLCSKQWNSKMLRLSDKWESSCDIYSETNGRSLNIHLELLKKGFIEKAENVAVADIFIQRFDGNDDKTVYLRYSSKANYSLLSLKSLVPGDKMSLGWNDFLMQYSLIMFVVSAILISTLSCLICIVTILYCRNIKMKVPINGSLPKPAPSSSHSQLPRKPTAGPQSETYELGNAVYQNSPEGRKAANNVATIYNGAYALNLNEPTGEQIYEIPNELYESFQQRASKKNSNYVENLKTDETFYENYENLNDTYEIDNPLYESLEKRKSKRIY